LLIPGTKVASLSLIITNTTRISRKQPVLLRLFCLDMDATYTYVRASNMDGGAGTQAISGRLLLGLIIGKGAIPVEDDNAANGFT
jgi:hypothetical protein